MRKRASPFVVLAAGLAVLGWACGDDASSAPDGGGDDAVVDDGTGEEGTDVPAEDAADVPTDAPGVSVTFIVVERQSDDTNLPLAGVTAAFDAPGGRRTEQVTGADGKVTFDDVVWSSGNAALTAHLDGYAVVSRVDLDEAVVAGAEQVDGAMAVWLSALPEAGDPIAVSGTATGLVDSAHRYIVNIVNAMAGSEWQGPGADAFSVAAPRDGAFTLQGVEAENAELPSGLGYTMTIHRVAHQSVPASGTDLTDVVLDFATNEVALETAVDTSVLLPSRAESRLRTVHARSNVCPSNSAYCTGWATSCDISADGNRIEATLVWTEPAWAEEPITLYAAYGPGYQSASYARVPGWPTAGDRDDVQLLDLPDMVAPPTPSTRHPLSEPFVWTLHDTGVTVAVYLLRDDGVVWSIVPPEDATTATAPALPSTITVEELLGTGVVEGYLFVSRVESITGGELELTAHTQNFVVEP